jgi:sulfatase maturation enzyme AslB (radical SAM superfamily)
MRKIFLSYSRNDDELARAFADMITALPQVTLFKDDRSIRVGDDWTERIRVALGEMDVFVALVSRHWIGSTWCKKEYEEAKRRHVTIVPVYLDPCPFDQLDIAKHEGYKAPGNKAITQFHGAKRTFQISEAVRRLADVVGPATRLEPPVDRLREYAMPRSRVDRPPLIVYHCGARTGDQPPGKQLKEALEELLGSDAEAAPPQLHDVTKTPGPPPSAPGQTVFVVDSPTANPVARDVLLNYQRYMLGRKIRHTTTLDRGIQLQTISADGNLLSSNRHRVALDDRGPSVGFNDYVVVMRLPGIVLCGDFSDDAAETTVWLVYGTTYRGSSAGAALFQPGNFQALVDRLASERDAPPAAFQAIFEVPDTPEHVTRYAELGKLIHLEVLQSLRDQVRGDPVPAGLGALLIKAQRTGDCSGIPLTAAHMDLVAACNYNCPGCIEAGLREKGWRLSFRKAATILTDLHDQGCRNLSFYGGEPTLHPNFVDIVKLASAQGFRPMVVTNGSRLIQSEIFRELKTLGNKVHLRVSIDAHSQDSYVKQHGSKSAAFRFDDTRDATLRLAEHVEVGISYLITRNNVGELAAAMEFWKKSAVKSFNPRFPLGKHGRWQPPPEHSEIRETLQSIPWGRYPSDWLVMPDWFLDWIRDGSEPSQVWAFSSCYSAYYRVVISPYWDATLSANEGLTEPAETDQAWLSLCPYHRYEDAYGCLYPDDFTKWSSDHRLGLVERIRPEWCERQERTVCSRVAHNTTVQAEINRLRYPIRSAVAPTMI